MFTITGSVKFDLILETTKTEIRNSSSFLKRDRYGAHLRCIKFVFW